jgi:hypothetical protein
MPRLVIVCVEVQVLMVYIISRLITDPLLYSGDIVRCICTEKECHLTQLAAVPFGCCPTSGQRDAEGCSNQDIGGCTASKCHVDEILRVYVLRM